MLTLRKPGTIDQRAIVLPIVFFIGYMVSLAILSKAYPVTIANNAHTGTPTVRTQASGSTAPGVPAPFPSPVAVQNTDGSGARGSNRTASPDSAVSVQPSQSAGASATPSSAADQSNAVGGFGSGGSTSSGASGAPATGTTGSSGQAGTGAQTAPIISVPIPADTSVTVGI